MGTNIYKFLLSIILAFYFGLVSSSLISNREIIFKDSKREVLEKFIVDAKVNDPSRTVVILINSFHFFSSTQNSSRDFFLERLKNLFDQVNYSYVVINAPCESYACLDDFRKISDYILKLKPEEVLFHASSSGWNTDVFYEKLNHANIPIIVFHTELSIFYQAYVGIDNSNLGKTLGGYVNSQINEKDKVIIVHTLKGVKNDDLDNGLPRLEAAMKELNKATILETTGTSWSRSKSYELILQLLESNPDTKWIITPSYETALGAFDALLKLGIPQKVKIGVMDFTYETAISMERGMFEAAVSHNLQAQAEEIMRIILTDEYVIKDKNKPKKLFQGILILKENISRYKNRDGSFDL